MCRNTDNNEAVDLTSTRTDVTITRQGPFVRSGPEIADEVFRSSKRILTSKLLSN